MPQEISGICNVKFNDVPIPLNASASIEGFARTAQYRVGRTGSVQGIEITPQTRKATFEFTKAQTAAPAGFNTFQALENLGRDGNAFNLVFESNDGTTYSLFDCIVMGSPTQDVVENTISLTVECVRMEETSA